MQIARFISVGQLAPASLRLSFSMCAVTLALCTAVAAAPGKTQQLTSANQVPEGLAKSDWQSIRAAHEGWQHSFHAVEGGHIARTPGQQWRSHFDARGFLTEPIGGGWSWGMELQSYGFPAMKSDRPKRRRSATSAWRASGSPALGMGFSRSGM